MSEDVKKIAEELVIACKRAYARGIQTGSDGNASARAPGRDLTIVKTSGSSFIGSTPGGLVIANLDGSLVEGEGKPAREVLLYDLLYRICPKVNAAVHTRSPYLIVRVSTGKALKRTTWHIRLKMSADLPTLDTPAATVEKEYSLTVEEIYRENPDLPGFLLVGHGLVTVGKDVISAEHTAELTKETARVATLKATVPKPGL